LSVELRYWDSNAFLAYFQEEDGRVDSCEAVLEEAEKGKILIVTSALTLAEVLALRGKTRLPPNPKLKKTVIDFFKNEYIAVQNVTREVAELARDLVWDRGIKPKDAVHVASAMAAGCTIFETYDNPLIRKGKKIKDIEFRAPPQRREPGLPLAGGSNGSHKTETIERQTIEPEKPGEAQGPAR
jgi:predicted nucleic acid-binding protein